MCNSCVVLKGLWSWVRNRLLNECWGNWGGHGIWGRLAHILSGCLQMSVDSDDGLHFKVPW